MYILTYIYVYIYCSAWARVWMTYIWLKYSQYFFYSHIEITNKLYEPAQNFRLHSSSEYQAEMKPCNQRFSSKPQQTMIAFTAGDKPRMIYLREPCHKSLISTVTEKINLLLPSHISLIDLLIKWETLVYYFSTSLKPPAICHFFWIICHLMQ